ncbi:MAG: DUF2934 domain-containing protein [Bryobacteraceae bacterium]
MNNHVQIPSGVEIQLMDAIRNRAQELWEAEGRPDDASLLHWLVAEAQIRSERGLPPASDPEAGA